MEHVRINRWLDLLDRVGWTAIQAAAGAGLAALTTDGMSWKAILIATLTAAGVAAAKVTIGQNTGSDELGSVVPGQVIEHQVEKSVDYGSAPGDLTPR